MEKREYAEFRRVVVLNPNGGTTDYNGEEVYGISELGIVIIQNSPLRHLIPWHRVVEFTYDINDDAARNIIQGY